MDPHTHDHKQLIMNTSWGEGSSSIHLENMASMDNHQHSHVFFHDQQHHNDPLPTSLDHHSPVWRSFSTDDTSYIVPFSHSNHIISSARPSSSATSLRFVGSSYAAHHHVGLPTDQHHQVTLDHRYLFSQVLCEEDEQGDKDKPGNNKDLCVDVNDGDEGIDHEEDEELSAMKEMMYKIAAMQPVDIDPSTICKPNRRNVRISDDPQSVAARHRRERISEKMRILQRLVPGGIKMDTASMLDEAIRYVKFLKRQIKHLQQDQNHPVDDQMLPASSTSLKSSSFLDSTSTPFNHQYRTAMANKQHQQQPVRFIAAASPSTTTDDRNYGIINSALLHHHDHLETEKPLDIMNMCTSSNNKVHHCMDNSSVVVIQNHLQMDILNQQQGSDRKVNTRTYSSLLAPKYIRNQDQVE